MEFLRRLEYDSLWFLSSFEIDWQFIAQPWLLFAFLRGTSLQLGHVQCTISFDVGSPLQDAHGKTFTASFLGSPLQDALEYLIS